MKRNLYNNPSGKPYCCHSGCNEDTIVEIRYSNELEDYTHSCETHLDELSKNDKPVIDVIDL